MPNMIQVISTIDFSLELSLAMVRRFFSPFDPGQTGSLFVNKEPYSENHEGLTTTEAPT